jgi:hypothetical protein
MDDGAQQLLIASRIHHALLRHLGSGIDVGAMLTSEDYACEVLYVCAGSGDEELQSLGRQFELLRQVSANAPEVDEDDGLEPMGSAPVPLDPLPLPSRRDRWLLRAKKLFRR